jgi:hypothetical protein
VSFVSSSYAFVVVRSRAPRRLVDVPMNPMERASDASEGTAKVILRGAGAKTRSEVEIV